MEIRVPLLNANEDEVVLTHIHVAEGDEVRAGQLLFSVESTKASMDVEAPREGFVRALRVAEDDRLAVGALLCVLTETADAPVEAAASAEASAVRATRKARALAEQHGIDLASLGVDGIVKERDVQAALGAPSVSARAAVDLSTLELGDGAVVVLGAGGHARVVVDVLREGHRALRAVAAVDDAADGPLDVLGVPVVGGSERLAELRELGVTRAILGVGAVTQNRRRVELYARLEDVGFTVPALVHPRASVEPSAQVADGAQIFAGAVVGSCARIGKNAIVNSGVVVSHDCVIGDHVHLTPGAILAGGVTVGENTVVGMGVTVYLGVTIGRDAVISNGVHVLSDVPDGAVLRAEAR